MFAAVVRGVRDILDCCCVVVVADCLFGLVGSLGQHLERTNQWVDLSGRESKDEFKVKCDGKCLFQR